MSFKWSCIRLDIKKPENPLVTMVSAGLSCLDWFLLTGGKEYLLQIQATEPGMSFPVGLLTSLFLYGGKNGKELVSFFSGPPVLQCLVDYGVSGKKREGKGKNNKKSDRPFSAF